MAWTLTSTLFNYFEKHHILPKIYASHEEGEKATDSSVIVQDVGFRLRFFPKTSKYKTNKGNFLAKSPGEDPLRKLFMLKRK